jgi:uncharacterized repeat protein (TIGR02543 family)
MLLFALSLALLLPVSPPLSVDDSITLTFTILNDDQNKSFSLSEGEMVLNPPTDFIQRDNAKLNGWYTDASLDSFYNFSNPILTNTTVYARWDYLNPAISLASLYQSMAGDRFESKTMVLSFPLYEPLRVNVRYQWQAAPQYSDDFDNIGGANSPEFSPFRNGTFQYRIRYRIPITNPTGFVTDTISYYSEPVTITIYGQQSQVGLYIVGGLMLLLGMVLFLRWKRPVYYDVAGGRAIRPNRFRVGEDISVQPKASKPGYRFLGWYTDDQQQHPFEGMRMPMKAVRLYAKFKKTKTNR